MSSNLSELNLGEFNLGDVNSPALSKIIFESLSYSDNIILQRDGDFFLDVEDSLDYFLDELKVEEPLKEDLSDSFELSDDFSTILYDVRLSLDDLNSWQDALRFALNPTNLIFCESFDAYTTETDLVTGEKWASQSGIDLDSTYKHYGVNGLKFIYTNHITPKAWVQQQNISVGLWLKVTTLPGVTTSATFLEFKHSNWPPDSHISVQIYRASSTTFKLTVRNGSFTSTTVNAFDKDVWYNIQIALYIADAGHYCLKVDGVIQLDEDQDTNAVFISPAASDYIYLSNTANPGFEFYLDSLYVLKTYGFIDNTYDIYYNGEYDEFYILTPLSFVVGDSAAYYSDYLFGTTVIWQHPEDESPSDSFELKDALSFIFYGNETCLAIDDLNAESNDSVNCAISLALEIADNLDNFSDGVFAMPGEFVELSYDTMMYDFLDSIESQVGLLEDLTPETICYFLDAVTTSIAISLLTVTVGESLSNWNDAIIKKFSTSRLILDYFAMHDSIACFLTDQRVIADTLSLSDAVSARLSTDTEEASDAFDLWNDLVAAEINVKLEVAKADSLNSWNEATSNTGVDEDLTYYRRYLNDVIR